MNTSQKHIYFLGPEGSFSHTVVQKTFGPENKFIPVNSFEEIVDKVEKDSVGIGALAIENSISSSVHVAIDIMYQRNLCIVAEAFMKLQMDLLGTAELKTIKEVYSHSQALAQCSKFIQSHNLKSHEMQSTAY